MQTRFRSMLQQKRLNSKKEKDHVMIKSSYGNDNQSFVIEIKSRENRTWQGTITWVEGKKQENFRSVLELIRLMDSTLADEGTEA